MRRSDVGYQSNEWVIIYNDDCGDRQILYCDTFEQASDFMCRLRKSGTNVIGTVSTRWYDKYVEKVLED
jgi:hypothetical protein